MTQATDPSLNPQAPNSETSTTETEGIISVNAHGRKRDGQVGPYLMIGGIAAVILVGGLLSLNVLKSKLAAPKPKPTTEGSAPVNIQFETETPPAIPGAPTAGGQGVAQAQPACADGSPGHPLRGTTGQVVRNGAGQAVTVCPDGQVLGTTAAATPSAAPIPVAGAPRGPNAVGYTPSGVPMRPEDGFMMLNDGKYGPAQSVLNLANPNELLQLMQAAAGASGPSAAPPAAEGLLTSPRAHTLEAELIPSKTPLVQASRLTNLHMLLPKGRSIDCGMSMRIVSSLAGQASCVVTQNVYSASGKVVLIERGSEAVGEYRSGASVGQKRLFVLWTRIITPSGVVINLDSPGADELGSTGLTGKVDNHWWERVGSAFLLSTVQDAIQYQIAREQARSGGSTVIFGNTAQAGNSMASRVLEQNISIPPTIYKHQGDRAIIYVARDLDFSSVYRLHAR